MRNIALKLMYNGTAYHGWQVQRNAVSVCETLQKALRQITGEDVHLTGCGRTDAGVHAERYVANLRTESRIPLERLPFAINTHTPEDIAVSEALEVAEDFNAIGSCLKKEYTYRIYNSRVKNPFYVNRAYFYPKRLDEDFLDRAAHMFVGTHDFAAVQGGEAVGGGGLVADGAAAGARAVGEVAAEGVKARAVPPGGQGHHAQNRRQHREEDQKAPEAPVLRPVRPAALRREGLTSFIH